MKFLRCGLCKGELDIIAGDDLDFVKLTKCRNCGARFQYDGETEEKTKEITSYIKRQIKSE